MAFTLKVVHNLVPGSMETAVRAFEEHFGRPAEIRGRAPGRVNLLGEHVDYNEGVVLPAAIDRAVRLAAATRADRIVNLLALDLGEPASFSLDELDRKAGLDGSPLPGWALYPASVAWSMQKAGVALAGLDAAYTSDIPIGAGLSSSAAVEVGFAAAWRLFAARKIDNLELARICQRGENLYVGVNSGLMDQFASANGVARHALAFDTRSLAWEAVPLPPGTSLVIADSGIRRELAGSAYNDRRAACEEAVAILKGPLPGIHSLRDVDPTEFAAYRYLLPPVVAKRAEHVIKEIHRVKTAVIALKRQEARSFGALMFAGHNSLRDLYEVSIPELDVLVDLARRLPGALGARLTGAGFGGCTVNLVEADQAETFITELKQGYRVATGQEADVFLCQASEGVQFEHINRM